MIISTNLFDWAQLDGIKLGIQFESERPEKDWPLENYYELIQELHNTNITPITFNPKITLPKVHGVSDMELEEVAHIIRDHIDIFLGSDSGLLHLATALGKPTLWLFGPTDSKLTLEFYDKARSIHHLNDSNCRRPCYYNPEFNNFRCNARHGDCMYDITVSEVLDVIYEMIDEYGK